MRRTGQYPRIPCVVPFCSCGSTSHPEGWEIICPKHYRLVDRRLKRLRRQAKRAGRMRVYHWLWGRIVAQAIERAAVNG